MTNTQPVSKPPPPPQGDPGQKHGEGNVNTYKHCCCSETVMVGMALGASSLHCKYMMDSRGRSGQVVPPVTVA